MQLVPSKIPPGPVLDAHKRVVAYLLRLVTVIENGQHGTTDEVYDLASFAYMMAPLGKYSPGQPVHTDLAYNVSQSGGEQESSQVARTHIPFVHLLLTYMLYSYSVRF
jgi:hypothetical protein